MLHYHAVAQIHCYLQRGMMQGWMQPLRFGQGPYAPAKMQATHACYFPPGIGGSSFFIAARWYSSAIILTIACARSAGMACN